MGLRKFLQIVNYASYLVNLWTISVVKKCFLTQILGVLERNSSSRNTSKQCCNCKLKTKDIVNTMIKVQFHMIWEMNFNFANVRIKTWLKLLPFFIKSSVNIFSHLLNFHHLLNFPYASQKEKRKNSPNHRSLWLPRTFNWMPKSLK